MPMDISSCHKFITELANSIFQRLNIPEIPCEFKEERPGFRAQYESTPNILVFFNSQIKDADENTLTWIVWHEVLHYYHELKLEQYNYFFNISNLEEFDFQDNKSHRDTIKDMFNDFLDFIVEKQIASLDKNIKPDYHERIDNITNSIKQYQNHKIPLANVQNGVLMDFIKIALILKFGDIPKESGIMGLYEYLPKGINKDEILSYLDNLSYEYPNDNPQLICKIFNIIATNTKYKLTFELKYIKELKAAENDFSFWIKQKNVRRIWTFILHYKKLKGDAL